MRVDPSDRTASLVCIQFDTAILAVVLVLA